MFVYRDFFLYKRGIYRCPENLTDPNLRVNLTKQRAFHSVRLIGWGEENVIENGEDKVIKYWTAANSWGPWWGENGFFRILRGENTCEIENYVLSSRPEKIHPNKNQLRYRRHHASQKSLPNHVSKINYNS